LHEKEKKKKALLSPYCTSILHRGERRGKAFRKERELFQALGQHEPTERECANFIRGGTGKEVWKRKGHISRGG